MAKSAQEYVDACSAIYARADREGRDLTGPENAQVQGLIAASEQQLAHEKTLSRLQGGGASSSVRGDGSIHTLSPYEGPGDVFVQSEGYKAIKDPDGRPQKWSSGQVEVMSSSPGLMMKGTQLESGAGGPGGGLVPPYYQPGIVSKLFEPLGVAQLFGSSQTRTGGCTGGSSIPPRPGGSPSLFPHPPGQFCFASRHGQASSSSCRSRASSSRPQP